MAQASGSRPWRLEASELTTAQPLVAMLHSQSAAELRHAAPRSLQAAGRNLVSPVLSSRPSSRGSSSGAWSEMGDDDGDDALFNRHVRASMKRRSQRGSGPVDQQQSPCAAEAKASTSPGGGRGTDQFLPPLTRVPCKLLHQLATAGDCDISASETGVRPSRGSRRSKVQCTAMGRLSVPEALAQVPTPQGRVSSRLTKGALSNSTPTLSQDRPPSREHTRTTACFEDLISFLDLHCLSGAYALVLSGNGVENLQQLLTLDDEALSRLLRKCDLDSMDEIMLLSAIRASRVLP
mmetsp:Transcript_101727/g.286846  ORF Transcript_101727/g.286846 Transcript_101727/m.286846 type:complete len:293 (+) Transcript_101727:2-880(+)